MVPDEGGQVPAGVRDQADPQAEPAQLLEDRRSVLVEVEVLVGLPGRDHLAGAGLDAGPLATEAADDVLRERDPQLVVVGELRMVAEAGDGRGARNGVTVRVEGQAVPGAHPDVAFRSQRGAGPRDREVDVEQHRAEPHAVGSP
jgi:hypothetical protein